MPSHVFRSTRRPLAWSALLAASWLALAGVAAAPAARGEAPAEAPAAACDATFPLVVNAALPLTADVPVEVVRGWITVLFREIDQRYDRDKTCPGRPLQVHVALGSDYQVLDWLGRGEVDVAVASSLSLHLLARDGVELSEIGLSDGLRDRVLPARRFGLRSVAIGSGGVTPRPDARADFAGFREWLWRGVTGAGDPLPAARALAAEPRLCEDFEPKAGAGSGPSYRLSLASHLSTAGLLDPVAETADWLEKRLAGEPKADRASAEECFWHSFFDHACFRFDGRGRRRGGRPAGGRGPGAAAPEAEPFTPCRGFEPGDLQGTTIEVRAEGERPPRDAAAGSPAAADDDLAALARDHLVMLTSSARVLFPGASLDPADGRLPLRLEHLFGSVGQVGEAETVPQAFRAYLGPEPYFGVRPFAFSIDESLRLVRLDQRTSRQSNLALILPGGGVKAAYQSRLIDLLYHAGGLANAHALPAPVAGLRPGGGPDPERGPLAVDSVIGTSGGALLGFFVARLGPQGPWNLSDLLWHEEPAKIDPGPGGLAAASLPISSSDVFGWTDLPRYASLVLILSVFGGALALASVKRGSWFSPPPAGGPPGDGTAPATRAGLLAILGAVLLAAPLVVRWVNGAASQEHVPEIEGLFYAALIALAMFADQCLVWQAPGSVPDVARGSSPWAGRWLMGVGLALVLGYALLKPLPQLAGWARWMEQPVSFRVAYLGLGTLATALGVGIVRLRRPAGRRRPAWVDAGLAAAAFALAGAVPLALLPLAPEGLLSWLDGTPLLLLSLLAVPAVIVAVRWAEGRPGLRDYLLANRDRITGSRPGRIGAAVLVPVLVCLGLADFCRPSAERLAGHPSLAATLAAPSRLDTPAGALFVCLGFVLLVTGVILWFHERRSRYRLTEVSRFVDALLLVSVGLAVAVYVLLLAGALLWPDRVSLFELTLEFWIDLVVVSVPLAATTVVWARLGRRGGSLSRTVHGAVEYLCSRHPNAHLVGRRFVRVGVLAVTGLVWWNFVLAPGLYGNRYADRYIAQVDQRFDLAYAEVHGCGSNPYRLTAKLLVPANSLESDATRFVLAVPGEEPCPVIRRSPGGGKWYGFRAVDGAGGGAGSGPGCVNLDLRQDEQVALLRAFVFASGSPFPIFPAHRVVSPSDGHPEALVDGGYSNNTPVEAAGALSAAQALIIDSSPALPSASGGPGLLASLHGPLVGNLLRLPGFLFERAQQVDRRSRKDLFVVSLAPVSRADWPWLGDFRRGTVDRMRRAANDDWNRRIGLVESWGPPNFQLSAEIGGPAADALSAGGG